MRPLILASGSPRRRAILRFAGIPFRVVAPRGVGEAVHPGEKPRKLVARLAVEKAAEVAGRYPKSLCLGADTVVAQGGRIFGKPKNKQEASRMLRSLSGKRHEVWTGVALVGKGGRQVRVHSERTQVSFRRLTQKEIARYLLTREPYDKAGAYAIQGTAGGWIRDWEGDYFNVMGLPVKWLIRQVNSSR